MFHGGVRVSGSCLGLVCSFHDHFAAALRLQGIRANEQMSDVRRRIPPPEGSRSPVIGSRRLGGLHERVHNHDATKDERYDSEGTFGICPESRCRPGGAHGSQRGLLASDIAAYRSAE